MPPRLHLLRAINQTSRRDHISQLDRVHHGRHPGTGALLDLALPQMGVQSPLSCTWEWKTTWHLHAHLRWLNLSCSSIGEISFRVLGGSRVEVSPGRAWGHTPGTVKLLLPPRQSRGNSLGY